MYAFVRFLEDNVCYALPVSCVRDFSPRSRLDFDNQKVYAVYRGPEELGAGPESPPRAPHDWGALLLHKAQILALAETSPLSSYAPVLPAMLRYLFLCKEKTAGPLSQLVPGRLSLDKQGRGKYHLRFGEQPF
uniref:BEN domain containing 5 n=1 Tax=Cebus imitator TaxID=2715852 RepID=A0A2K5QU76_CEBIM